MADRKYASDYRLEEYLTPSGKRKRRRVYQGPEYSFCQPPEKIRRLGWITLGCAVIALAGLFPLLCTSSEISRTWYVLLPMAFSLLPLYQAVLVGVRLLRTQPPLTREMRDLTDKRLRIGALWLVILAGLTCIGTYVYWILHGLEKGDWLFVIGHTVAAGAAVYLFTQRDKAKTKKIEK